MSARKGSFSGRSRAPRLGDDEQTSTVHKVTGGRDEDPIKIVVVGGQNVGKSCVVRRFVEGTYSDRRRPTIVCDFVFARNEVEGHEVLIHFSDLSHSELKSVHLPTHLASANAVLVVASADDRSVEAAEVWAMTLHDFIGNVRSIPIGLVLNKYDHATPRAPETLTALCDRYGFLFWSTCSAMTGRGVLSSIQRLTAAVIKCRRHKQAGLRRRQSVALSNSHGSLASLLEPNPNPSTGADSAPPQSKSSPYHIQFHSMLALAPASAPDLDRDLAAQADSEVEAVTATSAGTGNPELVRLQARIHDAIARGARHEAANLITDGIVAVMFQQRAARLASLITLSERLQPAVHPVPAGGWGDTEEGILPFT